MERTGLSVTDDCTRFTEHSRTHAYFFIILVIIIGVINDKTKPATHKASKIGTDPSVPVFWLFHAPERTTAIIVSPSMVFM